MIWEIFAILEYLWNMNDWSICDHFKLHTFNIGIKLQSRTTFRKSINFINGLDKNPLIQPGIMDQITGFKARCWGWHCVES